MNNSLALAALLLALGSSAHAQAAASPLSRIGAAAAVSGAVKAVAPNASVGRVIESGKPLYLNDHVTTDAAGRLQVLLLDETVFTLGPSSDMTLDEFVYDPKTNAGKVSAEITKGAFRFVTGKVARAHPENMKVKLAVGTIGVRGTVVAGETGKEGSTVINVGEGPNNNTDDRPSAITVSNSGTSRHVDLTGQGVKVLPGQAPSFPHDMADEIKRISAILAAPPKSKAGKEPNGTGSAGENSGQLSAAIKDLVIDSQQNADTQENGRSQTAIAAQFGGTIPNGISTWDNIRQNQTSGSGFYFSGEAGPINCTGCLSSAPRGSLQLFIDFGARTIGGDTAFSGPSGTTGSFIHIHGVDSVGNTDTIQQRIGLGGSGLSPISFSSLTGPATLVLNSTNLGPTTITTSSPAGGSFAGSSISLVNAGGVAAAQAQTSMTFSGSTGSSIPVSANGTFLSPR